MSYLNQASLDAASAAAFRQRQPYPWTHMQGTLTPEGWDKLRAGLPEISEFRKMVGVKRAHGQAPHDRGILHYLEGMDVAPSWQEFIAELQGPAYAAFLRRMLGFSPAQKFFLTMEWYYAWQGCSVSPHCDARRKIATHIFFFADDTDWPREWGGDILILDDEGRCNAHSAPGFDDLKVAASLDLRKNGSLLFQRTEHSWHGVRPLRSPDPGIYRKLFIVTVNIPSFQVWWRRTRGKDPDGYRFVLPAVRRAAATRVEPYVALSRDKGLGSNGRQPGDMSAWQAACSALASPARAMELMPPRPGFEAAPQRSIDTGTMRGSRK